MTCYQGWFCERHPDDRPDAPNRARLDYTHHESVTNNSESSFHDYGHEPNVPFAQSPTNAMTGWMCPRCGRVWSPLTAGCTCEPRAPFATFTPIDASEWKTEVPEHDDD